MDQKHAAAIAADAVKVGVPSWFCKDWATIKKGLNWVKKLLPSYLKPVVVFIVAAGDAIHAAGCKT